jgi:superfamily II DNA or RNA helicase
MQSHFLRVAPGMPSKSIERTIEHYTRLGLTATLVRDEFAIVERDGVEQHFALKPDHDPARTAMWIYIRVKDADAFYEDMKSASLDSKEPHDTDYRMREIPHSDPNNNLVLFGSALAKR